MIKYYIKGLIEERKNSLIIMFFTNKIIIETMFIVMCILMVRASKDGGLVETAYAEEGEQLTEEKKQAYAAVIGVLMIVTIVGMSIVLYKQAEVNHIQDIAIRQNREAINSQIAFTKTLIAETNKQGETLEKMVKQLNLHSQIIENQVKAGVLRYKKV